MVLCPQFVTLTEDATTSSSRIFLKTLFQDLSEIMGLIALNKRLQDPSLAQFFDGIFPKVRLCYAKDIPIFRSSSLLTLHTQKAAYSSALALSLAPAISRMLHMLSCGQ